MGKAYQSIAYLARGHWEPTIKKLKEASEYEKNKLIDKKSKTLELWFVFSDFFPKTAGSTFEDLKIENQWREDTTTALDIHESLHEYIEYRVGSFTEKQSKIAFWRICKKDKNNKEKLEIPFLIKTRDKDYENFCELYDIPEKKSVLHMAPKTELKYMDIFEAFVIDEILEIRHAKIMADGNFLLYDEKGKNRKLIKKGSIQDEHNAEDLKRIKTQVKRIEKAILSSGSASGTTVQYSTRASANASNYYSSRVNGYSSNPGESSVGAWVIFIIIAAIVLFFILSSIH